ncbi:MAG: sugar phosphate isomerase/epimerase family protein [Caldilinea sp.]|jgi:sugar phosphate isomerase/epimerase
MFSLTSDYLTDQGDAEQALRLLSEVGFTHVHWCHEWYSDFVYSDNEIGQIGRWLAAYGLQLNDTHGSEGIQHFWYAPEEEARRAGIELVKNRIDLTARLGGDAVVMHVYPPTQHPELKRFNPWLFDQIRRSLDEVEPYARACKVQIALENLIDFAAIEAKVIQAAQADDNAELLLKLFAAYDPSFLGFCFDSGHAVLGRNRIEQYLPHLERLAVLHLNDNDGRDDLHLPPYDGIVDWTEVAAGVAASPYTKPLSFELSLRHTAFSTPAAFLAHSYARCCRFADQVAAQRRPST